MDPTTGGALALTPATVGGRRHHKLKLVTKKRARKVLRKLGLKIRGGASAGDDKAPVALPEDTLVKGGEAAAAAAAPEMPAGGKRKTKKRSASRRRSSVFGY